MQLEFSRGTLTIVGASRGEMLERFGAIPWVWDARLPGWRCEALYYREVHTALEQWRRQMAEQPPGVQASVDPVEDHVPLWQKVSWPRQNLKLLRHEQEAAHLAWNRTGRGCVIMPTGTGKTEVALAIICQLSLSTLIVAPVRDLMYQWHRRLESATGYDAGIVGDGTMRVKPVSVTTYDSACIHMERFGQQFGLLVFDECHHLPGGLRRDAARMSAAPFRLGLTATRERGDGRHVELDQLIGPVVYELPLGEARGHLLADFDVIRIPVHLTPSEQARYERLSQEVRAYVVGRRKTEPHFTWEQLCADTGRTAGARHALQAFFAKQAIEDRAEEKLRVLEDLFRLHDGERFLIFAGSNAMARDVSRRFLIPCLLSHCGKHERREVLSGLEAGHYRALVANQVLDEGVDMPAVKVAVVIGGTSSTRQAQQRLGRVLRKTGDARAVLYEIVCRDTTEEQRSRRRRDNDAYRGTKHRRMPPC